MRAARFPRAFSCASFLALSLQIAISAAPPGMDSRPTDEAFGPYVDSWILVRLAQKLENRSADGGYLLSNDSPGLNALIVEKGVHRIDDALTVTMRDPRNPEALARYGLDRTYRFHVPAGSDIPALVREFSRAPGVAFAEPDYIHTADATIPDDTLFVEQWNLDQTSDADIDAPEAWDLSTGSDLIIGIMDSGADDTHPDLDAKLVPGWDFVNDDPDTFPDGTSSHGTHVASIAAAETDNAEGIAGICWNCRLMPLKVFGDNPTTTSMLADAVAWAVDEGVRLLNYSGGGSGTDQTFLDGLAYAYDAGAIFVTSSGNNSLLRINFPGRDKESIAVGNTGPDDIRRPSSNYGPQIDVVAPGYPILGAMLGGGYETQGGTSFASPHVAGLLGIVLSIHPSVGQEEARYLVRVGAEDEVGDPLEDTPGFDFYHGWGRISIFRTLQSTRAATTLQVSGKASTVLSYDTPDPFADSWDFVRGDLSALAEDRYGVDLGAVVCLENDSADSDTTGNADSATPAPGEAFFYVARPNGAPGAGSYGGSTVNRDRVVFPVKTGPAAVLEIDQDGARFGSAVGSAGDVNGDGYDDVIVGAEGFDGANTDSGIAYVYHGSSSGIVSTPAWSAEGSMADASRGWSVATAGDVNNDDHDDIIVGEPTADGGVGRAYVYLGSASGVAGPHNWMGKGRTLDANYGFSVRSAGDVNGDGYDDVIIGAYLHDGSLTDEGTAVVHLGSASGVVQTPAWSTLGSQEGARLGVGVSTAGDVNGDGYDDVIVGAPLYDAGETDEGRIFVYHGSSSGLSPTADWTWESDTVDARLGYSVGTAGDVNNDGYDDVIAGAWYYTGPEPQEGKVFVFLGSASGLASAPVWSFEHNQGDAQLGIAGETAGDVNNDGYDDIVVGANFYDGVRTRDGAVWVFLGTDAGVAATPLWFETGVRPGAEFGWRVGSAGDVNGDLVDDLIIGARLDDNAEIDEGRAFVFHGPLSMTTTDCP
jgi:hypothetical protein